jgi:hypothetical protein
MHKKNDFIRCEAHIFSLRVLLTDKACHLFAFCYIDLVTLLMVSIHIASSKLNSKFYGALSRTRPHATESESLLRQPLRLRPATTRLSFFLFYLSLSPHSDTLPI